MDLAKLRELLPPDKPALSGKLAVEGFDVTLDPLRVVGNATLDNVETKLEHGPVSISAGPAARAMARRSAWRRRRRSSAGRRSASPRATRSRPARIAADFDTSKS